MDGLIQIWEEVSLPPGEFYKHLDVFIDEQSPVSHMSCDYLANPLGLGLVIYPPRVYETIERLKLQEQNHGKS